MAVKVIDHGWNKLKGKWSDLNKSHTKVGLPQEGTPAAVTDAHSNTMADLVQIGAIHEFGAPARNIPERSFIRTTFDANVPGLKRIVAIEYQNVVEGKTEVRQALSRIGEWMTAKTRLRIKNRIPPPLHPATIAAKTVNGKKGDVPLIDTAQLIQSIQHVEVIR